LIINIASTGLTKAYYYTNIPQQKKLVPSGLYSFKQTFIDSIRNDTRVNISFNDNDVNLVSKDVIERKAIGIVKDKTEPLSSKNDNSSRNISMDLIHGAAMNIRKPQISPPSDDSYHSKVSPGDEFLSKNMGYIKKYKETEIGRKTFELKEVKLAGFAIESNAKTTMSDNGMNRFVSDWVKGDEIDTKTLKGLGDVSKGLVRSLNYLIHNDENAIKPVEKTNLKKKAEAIYQERQAKRS